MATLTTILSLRKPDGTDFVNRVNDLNNNWDALDTLFSSSVGHSHAGSGTSGKRIASYQDVEGQYDPTEAATFDTLSGASHLINNLNRVRYWLTQISGQGLGTVATSLNSHITGTGIVHTAASFGFADGTAGAPSAFFSSDTDTGIYRFGTNDFGIAAFGRAVAEFLSNGAGTEQDYTQIKNGTGNVTISGVGGSTNINVTLTPKGSGGVIVVGGGGYIAVGTTPATTGTIRIPYQGNLTAKNSSGTDIDVLSMQSGGIRLGNTGATPITLATSASVIIQGTDLTGGDGLGYRENPNLVLNSDFARKTILPGAAGALAMPEVFADLSGTTKIDAGAAGSVAANIFTQGAAANEYAWANGSFVWRDGRASATFKMVSTTHDTVLRWRISAADYVDVDIRTTASFGLIKSVAGARSYVAIATIPAPTVNRWYWLELDKQGTTFTAKIYDTLGTVPGVTKANSTLIQTLTGTIADAGLQLGAHISINSDQASAQWGGIAASPGGVYLEPYTWESVVPTLTGGGMAIGTDETADSGPLGKQKAAIAYVPATSRLATMDIIVPFLAPSTAYTLSWYIKNSGLGGSGVMARISLIEKNSAGATLATTNVDDAAEVAWTRKTGTVTTQATTTNAVVRISINPSSTRTGTVRFLLPQLELGSAATAWRNAPADDGAASVLLIATPAILTSVGYAEVDSRDLACNFDMPWDGVLTITPTVFLNNGGLNQNSGTVYIDGGAPSQYPSAQASYEQAVAGKYSNFSWTIRIPVSAGKHRIALRLASSAGSLAFSSNPQSYMVITATRGK